jgi:hypothetical protein
MERAEITRRFWGLWQPCCRNNIQAIVSSQTKVNQWVFPPAQIGFFATTCSLDFVY